MIKKETYVREQNLATAPFFNLSSPSEYNRQDIRTL